MSLTKSDRLALLVELGNCLVKQDARLMAHVHRASVANRWFTRENILRAVEAIQKHMLRRQLLEPWLDSYSIAEEPSEKTIAVVAAGNIPLVAWQDVLCAFAAGFKVQIKLSERDAILMPFLCKCLGELEPSAVEYFTFVERLSEFDGVIATGSNNSARYFEQYFRACPTIIRKNRNGVAVLTGNESEKELNGLAIDVFSYFGMGCRNVTHLMIPAGYDLTTLTIPFQKHRVIEHDKYKNNYDYNLALKILNHEEYFALDNLILQERNAIASPVSCLFYQYYKSPQDVEAQLNERSAEIQCVVSREDFDGLRCVRPGMTQEPGLADYPDGIDIMAFLSKLAR